jgi:hypothetical protein
MTTYSEIAELVFNAYAATKKHDEREMPEFVFDLLYEDSRSSEYSLEYHFPEHFESQDEYLNVLNECGKLMLRLGTTDVYEEPSSLSDLLLLVRDATIKKSELTEEDQELVRDMKNIILNVLEAIPADLLFVDCSEGMQEQAVDMLKNYYT